MRRRDVVIAGVATVLTPRRVAAQTGATIHRVGVLATPGRVDTLRSALAALGYGEGRNLVLEVRTPPASPDQLANVARDLIGRNVAVIVVGGTENVKAVRALTRTIPIVMALVGDPVGQGFIATFARPGGNITGVTNVAIGHEGKRLELLREADPRVKQVAVLWNPPQPAHAGMLKALDTAAEALGVAVQRIAVPSPADLESALATVKRTHATGITMLGSSIHFGSLRTIADFALRAKLPSIAWTEEFPRAGGLLGYGATEDDQFRRTATYVDRILRGANPADLPVEQPTTFVLTINRRTAAAIGLTLPQSVLARADAILE
jgi:putative ABC transport system substrate-binding protein